MQNVLVQNVWLWCARLTWMLLPFTAGSALADALDSWSSAPAAVAAVLAWSAWVAGLIALLAPRPWGCTVVRVVAPSAVVVAIAAASSTSRGSAVIAIGSTGVAAFLALAPPFARAAANALAYGDERRYPLRIPTPLLVAPVPLAVGLIAAGVAAGPLLLADGRIALGFIGVVIGIPLAAVLARSLHALSRRWLVAVPAGLVIVDPLILVDPALVRREQVRAVSGSLPEAERDRALDLRLGTSPGITILLRAPVAFARRQGRTRGALVETDVVLVAPVRRTEVLEALAARQIATARRSREF